VVMLEGEWFAALPAELRGELGLVVSNPPYVATTEPVPAAVSEWEPHQALYAGADGLDALRIVIADAVEWLRPDGVLVCEIGERHGAAVAELAHRAGFTEVRVEHDLTGRDRILVAHH
jgi:release factor glutamine methyltransferase